MTRDEFFQELFQRPPTQEEQHRFDRFQNVMSLAIDDSMWYVILVRIHSKITAHILPI